MAKDRNKKREQKSKKRKKAQAAKKKKRGQRTFIRRQESEKNAQRAFGSTVFCWRPGFRSLFFDTAPNLSEELDFSGMDLHLQWYPSQQARSAGEEGEIITSLRIDSCREVARPETRAGKKMFLRCKASMAQNVLSGSFYGDWHRELSRNTAEEPLPEETEWHELEFEFTLHLLRFKKGEAAAANKSRPAESLPYSENCWNVFHISFANDIIVESNPLDADRAYELVSMLRIWTPILSSSDYSVPEDEDLESQLIAIEKEEQQRHDALAVQSARTESLLSSYYSSSESEGRQLQDQAIAQMHTEFEAADAYTRSFLQWQRLTSLLSLSKS